MSFELLQQIPDEQENEMNHNDDSTTYSPYSKKK